MSAGYHNGHRERMRSRYLREGSFSSFTDHELLEMQLATVIARKDTNELAHRMLERFGTIRNIMEASVEDLRQVEGIGEITAVELKISLELVRRYLRDIFTPSKKCDTISEILKFLYPKFLGQTSECVYMLMLDNRMRLLDFRLISTGTVNQSNVPISKMVKIVMDKNAPNVIVAHNHPHGVATASNADRAVTEALYQAFSLIGINLIEHLIFTENEFFPILKRFPVPHNRSVGEMQFQSATEVPFYDVDDTDFTFSEFFDRMRPDSDLLGGITDVHRLFSLDEA